MVDVVCINTGSGSAWTATGEAMVRRWNQCVSGGGHTAAGATTPAPIAGETILSWQVNTSGNQVAHSMAAFAPALVNLAPAAHAGPDQTVIDTDGSGDEAVTLDGSASLDIDGTIVSHAWTSAGEPIAAGASPTVTLAAGTHPIELTVADEQGATDTDTVVITVAADGAPDIDLLAAAIRSGQNDPRFDLNSDGAVDAADLAVLVRDVLGTELGDANLDGRVNLDDFVILKTHFGRPGGWADGDFDASGAIDLDDFVILKTGFGFGG